MCFSFSFGTLEQAVVWKLEAWLAGLLEAALEFCSIIGEQLFDIVSEVNY